MEPGIIDMTSSKLNGPNKSMHHVTPGGEEQSLEGSLEEQLMNKTVENQPHNNIMIADELTPEHRDEEPENIID